MVQARTGTNFDIDAITRLVNADANAPALIEQPFVDPVVDAFAADVDDMVDELRFNPSSNLSEEAAQIMNLPGVAKLGAGVLAGLRAAVQLQEEKADNSADAFMRSDRILEEREKSEEKERKSKADIAKFAEDAADAQQLSTKPDQYGLSEQNYSDLNDQLKTRDGQERMMAFLRMMYPNKTDAERVELLQNMTLIARAESPEGTEEDRRAVEALDPAKATEARGAMRNAVAYGNGQTMTPEAAPPAAIVAATDARVADTTTISVAGSQAWLEQDFATAPLLRTNFVAANAATAPLDSPAAPSLRPEIASLATAQPAQPQAPSGSGFDV